MIFDPGPVFLMQCTYKKRQGATLALLPSELRAPPLVVLQVNARCNDCATLKSERVFKSCVCH